ncbi:MAG: DUF2071 domain-containing protein [Opitutales bacterium]
MLYRLKRHPFAIEARLERVLVLTYAFPQSMLEPLLTPGLQLDTYEDFGFVAVAFVEARHLRPKGLPGWLGMNFRLCGYRIFARYQTRAGRTLRGLRILRTETDRRRMVLSGNLLTHYNYHQARMSSSMDRDVYTLSIVSSDSRGDIEATIQIGDSDAELPSGSPFPDERNSRRFAGPMPYTFDYEGQTHSMIRIEGVRKDWKPRLVRAEVERLTFLEQAPFQNASPRMANAYFYDGVDYQWRTGIREPLNR